MNRLHSLWKNIALTIAAILLGLVISEWVVRTFIPVRNVGPSFTVYDPFYGKRLKKNFSCRRITPEFTMTFTTNAEGFRGPEIDSMISPAILFIGDSFTMGYGVNDGEEFPSLIRTTLNDSCPDTINVINAGLSDNGNGRWVKYLRNDAKRYNPKIVVFQIHSSDYYDNLHEHLFEVSQDGDLNELPVPADKVKQITQKIIDSTSFLSNSYLVGFVIQVQWYLRHSQLNNNIAKPQSVTVNEMLEKRLLNRLMEEVLTICKNEQWRSLFVLVDISPGHLEDLKKLFKDYKIPMIVIPNRQERPDLYYKVDLHWNVSGHKYVADQILKVIKCGNIVN